MSKNKEIRISYKMNIGTICEDIVASACRYAFSYQNKRNSYSRLVDVCYKALCASGILENVDSFFIESCHRGESTQRHPSTADIVFYHSKFPNRKVKRLSIKHNNISCKHHRPYALCTQMRINDSDICMAYVEKYDRINDNWYQKWQKYELFSQVPPREKTQWYREINELTKYFLERRDIRRKHMYTYLNFILDVDTEYVITVNIHKETAKVNRKNINIGGLLENLHITIHRNSLQFYSNDVLFLRMRLHNCTSRITPRLGVKYDAKTCYIFN